MNARKPDKTNAAMVPFAKPELVEAPETGEFGGSGRVVFPVFPDAGGPLSDGGKALQVMCHIFSITSSFKSGESKNDGSGEKIKSDVNTNSPRTERVGGIIKNTVLKFDIRGIPRRKDIEASIGVE